MDILKVTLQMITSLEKTQLAFPLQMAYFEVTNINMADSAL